MASDLIYREDAKDFVRHAYNKGLNPIEYLDEVPAADVVEVVRCKDCIDSVDGFYCQNGNFGGKTFPNNFCSEGERRTE